MFLGMTQARTDAKARLPVPAGYRRQLDGCGEARIVLAPSLTDDAIHCYPYGLWLERVAKVAALPQSDPVVDLVKKLQFAFASDSVPDGQGRVLLPTELRESAGIEPSSDVTIVGQGVTFDLWAAARWQHRLQAARDALPGLRPQLAALGL